MHRSQCATRFLHRHITSIFILWINQIWLRGHRYFRSWGSSTIKKKWNPIRDRACLKRAIELHNYGIVRAISRRVHRVAYLAHLLNHIDDELLGTERRISELEIHLQISGFSLGSIASIINPPSGTANSLGMSSAVRPSGTIRWCCRVQPLCSQVLIR